MSLSTSFKGICLLRNSLTASLCLLLIGCTSTLSSFKQVQRAGQNAINEALRHAVPTAELPHVRYSDDFYVPELIKRDQDKPQWFFDQIEGRYLNYTLAEAMRDVLAHRGVNIRYLDSLDKHRAFALIHKGTVGGMLDKISFATKYSYEINGDLLTWRKFKIAEFDVAFIAGTTEYLFGSKENSQAAASNASSGGAASTVVTDTGFSSSDEFINFSTTDLSIWADLKRSLDLLKSSEGQIVINQATSSILVKDFLDNVAAIGDYIAAENRKLTQMIAVDIQIIKYTADEGDQHGVNWQLVKQDLVAGGVLALQTAFNTLLQDDLAPTILGFTQQTGKYAGSQFLINALEQHGVVTSIKHRRLVSLNNQVSKLVEGDEIGYLAQSGGTATANVGSQDNLIAGILKTGDAIYMLPNAVDDKVIIQLSTKLTSFKALRSVSSGDRSIETPQTTNAVLFLKFAVNDGETLLISSSSEERREYRENSSGGLILLGGEAGGKKSSRETIILITPRIIHG